MIGLDSYNFSFIYTTGSHTLNVSPKTHLYDDWAMISSPRAGEIGRLRSGSLYNSRLSKPDPVGTPRSDKLFLQVSNLEMMRRFVATYYHSTQLMPFFPSMAS